MKNLTPSRAYVAAASVVTAALAVYAFAAPFTRTN